MPDLIVISCGAAKLDHKARASEMYVGGYFKALLAFARLHAPDDRIRILSALHGLLPLDRVIWPYEQRMGKLGSVSAGTVCLQALSQGLLGAADVWLVCGRPYTRVALRAWPEARCVLEGRGGMGQQLRWLANEARSTA